MQTTQYLQEENIPKAGKGRTACMVQRGKRMYS